MEHAGSLRPPIPSLTGLRFFAALGVVLSHAIPTIIKWDGQPLWLTLLSQTAAEGLQTLARQLQLSTERYKL